MTDSEYIQNLIDETARKVFIPGGTYILDKPIVLTGQVELRSQGEVNFIHAASLPSDCGMIHIQGSGRVLLENVTLIGQSQIREIPSPDPRNSDGGKSCR